MTTRRRARNEDGEFLADNLVTPAVNEAYEDRSLAFLQLPDPLGNAETRQKAIDLAKKAIEVNFRRGLPPVETLPDNYKQAVRLTAIKLLLQNKLDEAPDMADLPLTARYHIMRSPL